MTLQTAGGLTICDQVIDLKFPHEDIDTIAMNVVESTPPLFSVGQLCMDKGFAFVWPRGSEYPYLEGPNGEVIYLEVHDYVPYDVLDDSIEQANPAV